MSKIVNRRLPPGQTPIAAIMRWGIDHPGIISQNPVIRPGEWILTVDGEVENPLEISWKELNQLPAVENTSDFHCVEGWSVLDCRWKGVHFTTVASMARPKPQGKYVWFESADGYTTQLPLADLTSPDVLIAYELNGQPLPVELGGPVRLIVPNKYAYKSPMWLTHMSFVKEKRAGYWELRGYSDTADIWKNDRRAASIWSPFF